MKPPPRPGYSLSSDIETRKIAATELASLFIGKQIGFGSCRWVFEHVQDPTCVVKAEMRGSLFQNAIEWNIWSSVNGTKWEKWFAPCCDISPNGYYLIQKKVTPVTMAELPKRLPGFFTDTKLQNFGRYQGRIVCCDYGVNINTSLFDHKFKNHKPKWWSEQ